MSLSLVVLLLVLLLIAVRRIGTITLSVWHIMGAGACVVIITGEISLPDALRAIDPDIMIFLFCTFVIGQALEESGYLAHLSYAIFKRAGTMNSLLAVVIGGSAAASALLMNDTLAIVGTPVMLLLAKRHNISPKPLLLALMFSITIGSVPSPIGNPQNLYIALHSPIPNPFITFLAWLFIPTVVNLGAVYLLIRRHHSDEFHDGMLRHSQEPIKNHRLAVLARISLQLMLVLIVVKILLGIFSIQAELRLTHIAAASALPILVAAPRRWALLKRIDWPTMAFFAAMFILMQSVWNTGTFQNMVRNASASLTSIEAILLIGIVLSQIISNVPLVALYQPLLLSSGILIPGLMALAGGSTIAGNLTIMGAASNIIVLQSAEKRGWEGMSYAEFFRIGLPLTLINAFVYLAYFRMIV
ncbi:MAG: arsenite permease [Bacteroidia bacterium]|nr:MAG: arsenite permease [Bacteroidia bacterium]